MAMEKDVYEGLLNELNDPAIEHTRRVEVLQLLRTDYTGVHTDIEEFTKSKSKLEKDNMDLVVANSQLFRQLGTVGDTKKEEETQQKEFSETVTIEQLERVQ